METRTSGWVPQRDGAGLQRLPVPRRGGPLPYPRGGPCGAAVSWLPDPGRSKTASPPAFSGFLHRASDPGERCSWARAPTRSPEEPGPGSLTSVIPRLIHQIWVGPAPLPTEFERFVDSWRRHHVRWEHHLWTEDRLPTDLRHTEALERIRHPAERADLLRFELLARHGGVYVDTDFECLRSIEPVIDGADFVTALLKPPAPRKPQRVNNAFMACIPRHPLVQRAVAEMRPQEWYGFDKSASGSLFFNRLVRDFPEVRILPADLFYPASPEQEATAVAIHYSARSWANDDDLRQAEVRARRRLREVEDELEQERLAHEQTRRRVSALRHFLATHDPPGLARR